MEKSDFVKSPIFYMGNKYKLLPQLQPLFPKNIDTLYDLFGGSGCISANINAKKIIYNEINDDIVSLYKLFLEYTPEELDTKIKTYIKEYNLNTEGENVKQNDPTTKDIRNFYNNNYVNFRKTYNNSTRDYVMLYTLTFYSFSNLIRFNSDNDFNMPYGNRCYTHKHYKQIQKWHDVIENKKIEISQVSAFDILNNAIFNINDFIYLDPPYSNTLAIYNEKHGSSGWTIDDDEKLFTILEKLNKCGIRWGMSNVFVNKGHENTHLIKWCKKNNWNVHHLNINYAALGRGNSRSDEVYICNYNTFDDLN